MKERFSAEQMPIDKDKVKQIEAEKLKNKQSPINSKKIKEIENEKKKKMYR